MAQRDVAPAFTKETSSHRGISASCADPMVSSHVFLHLPRPLYFAVFLRFIVQTFKAIFETANLRVAILFSLCITVEHKYYFFTAHPRRLLYNLIREFLRITS